MSKPGTTFVAGCLAAHERGADGDAGSTIEGETCGWLPKVTNQFWFVTSTVAVHRTTRYPDEDLNP